MSAHPDPDLFAGCAPADEPLFVLPRLSGGDHPSSPPGSMVMAPLGTGQADRDPPEGGASGQCSDRGDRITGAPLSGGLPHLRAFVLSLPAADALAAVLQTRIDQMERWGHTPESDAEKKLDFFIQDITAMARAAREDHQFRLGNDQLRKRIVRLAAMCLATLDRIDIELAAEAEAASTLDPECPL